MSANQQSFADLFRGPITPVKYDPPRHRNTDPPSSLRAEIEVVRNGVVRGQKKIALELVTQYPGKTSKELAELGTLDRYQLARRLSDLYNDNLVRSRQIGNEDLQWWAA